MAEKRNLVAARPAETGAILAAAIVGLLVAYRIIPEDTAANWIIVIGATPAVITSIVVFFRRSG